MIYITGVSGVAGAGAGAAMGLMASTSTWGAVTIGCLAGDAALGGAILAFSPVFGVALAVVVGVAVASYVSYQASSYVEELWDSESGKELRKKVTPYLEKLWDFIKSAWKNRDQMLLINMYTQTSSRFGI